MCLILGNKITKNLRDLIFRSIIRQEIAFFDKVKTGELINRLSTDTTIVGTSVTMNISDGLRSVTQATGGIAIMVCHYDLGMNVPGGGGGGGGGGVGCLKWIFCWVCCF